METEPPPLGAAARSNRAGAVVTVTSPASGETEPLLNSDSLEAAQRVANAPKVALSAKKRRLLYALPALLLCQFVIRFDSSYIIGNYSRRIATELHDFQNARWLVLGFLVTESSFAPLYGHAAQVYGHRNAILFAAASMSVGLFLCSLSDRLWQVSLSRVVVGTGTAGVELLIVVIINDLVQLYELPLWTSATTICGTVGLMLGGPVGAALTDRLGFRPTFALEGCGMVITLVALYLTLRLPKQQQTQQSEHTTKRLELMPAALLLAAVAVPLFALNLGGEIFPWTHPAVITSFCITPALIALFYYTDTRHAATPIVPRRFIGNTHIAIALACTLPMKFVFDQLRFSFGTYLEARSFGTDSSFPDWALTCVYFGRSLGTVASGIIVRRYRKFKPFLKLNIVVDIVIYLCLTLGWIHPEQPPFAPVLAFIGATEGFAEGLWLVAVLSLVGAEDQPMLYAFFGLSMAVSGDLGIAISLSAEGSLVRSKLNALLRDYPDAEKIIRESLKDLNYIRQLPPKVQTAILEAFVSSTEIAFGLSCLILVISLTACFYVKEMSASSRGVSYVT